MTFRRPSEKVVLISLDRNIHSRYLYSLIKSLQLEGIHVFLKARADLVFSLSRSQYGRLVFKERLVTLRSYGKDFEYISRIGHSGCSTVLVPEDFLEERKDSTYSVPMLQHPMMYSNGYWNQSCPESASEPKNAVLFIGNSSEETYSQLTRESVFDVAPRPTLLEFIRSLTCHREIKSFADLDSVGDGTIALIDSNDLAIPIADFRMVVSRHRFFLCAPGAFMPLCHNLIESLSVGAIPIIQLGYANLINPPLQDGLNAIVFEDLSDLEGKISRLFATPEHQLGILSKGALRYYHDFLTPKSVVGNITSPKFQRVKLLAGELTVQLYRQSTARSAESGNMPHDVAN